MVSRRNQSRSTHQRGPALRRHPVREPAPAHGPASAAHGADRVHDGSAAAAVHEPGGRVVSGRRVEGNARAELRQLGADQRLERVERGALDRVRAQQTVQAAQMQVDAGPRTQVGSEILAVVGEQEAPLPGLRVLQARLQGLELVQDLAALGDPRRPPRQRASTDERDGGRETGEQGGPVQPDPEFLGRREGHSASACKRVGAVIRVPRIAAPGKPALNRSAPEEGLEPPTR